MDDVSSKTCFVFVENELQKHCMVHRSDIIIIIVIFVVIIITINMFYLVLLLNCFLILYNPE